MRKFVASMAALAISAPLMVALMGSDHKDGPSATADHPADIADLYAWHNTAAGTFTTVLTFAGFGAPGTPATYDPDVLYSIHVNRNAGGPFSNVSDVDLNIRFAKNARGAWGVQVQGIPGAAAAVAGTVETELQDGPRKVWAGLRDDPFFFDLDGFKATVATGNISFNSSHDTFAGTNVTAVVIELPLADMTVNGTLPHLSLWATTSRKPQANACIPIHHTDNRVARR